MPLTLYKPRNWKTIIDLDEWEKELERFNAPPTPPQPPPDWWRDISRSDVPARFSFDKLVNQPPKPYEQPFERFQRLRAGFPSPKVPIVTTPKGKQFAYPMSETELASMTSAERVFYEAKPQEWLKQRDDWIKLRRQESTIKFVANLLGIPSSVDTPADQLSLAVNTALWIAPVPAVRIVKGGYRLAKGALPQSAKDVLVPLEETVTRIAKIDIGQVVSKSGGKITQEMATKAKQTAIEALSSERGGLKIPKKGKIIPEVGKSITPEEAAIRENLRAIGAGEKTAEQAFSETKAGIPPTKPPIEPPVAAKPSEDEILNAFGKRIASPKTTAETLVQKELWATERAKRSTRFSELLEQERAKGTSAEESIRNATNAFKGEFPRVSTGLDLPSEFKDAAYAKVIKVIQADDTIPQAMKAYEIAATKTALDNALWGKPIPDILGIKGGSAKTRLLKVFNDNPIIKEIIDNPKDVQKRLLESMLPPETLDAETLNYLRNVKNIPFGRAGLGERYLPPKPIEVVKETYQGQRLQEFLIDIAKAPSTETFTPAQASIPFGQARLGEGRFISPTMAPVVKEAYKGQRLQELMIDLAKAPSTETMTPAQAVMRFEQFNALPPTKRETILSTLKAIGINAIDALGIPKALKFGYDISMPLRQGIILGVRHPVAWKKMWKPMLQALKSEEIALKLNNEMLTDPLTMQAIQKMGLDLYGVEKGLGYMARPESMASLIAEKYIPGVRPSARSAAVAMNKLMTDVGVKNYGLLQKMGASEEEYKAMGSLINQLAGRGTLPKWAQGNVGDILNKLLTSPRYLVSRFEWPTKLLSSSKAVRQEAASTLVAWSGLMGTIVGLAYAGGARVELDPRSADAYKIRIRGKRIDVWVGYAQIARFLAQLVTGQRKTRTGEIIPITRAQVLGRYAQSKESPGIGALVTLMSGENYVGEDLSLKTLQGIGKFAKETFMPAALEEMVDAYAEEGSQSAILSGLGLLGASISTYENRIPRKSGGGIRKRR